MKVLIPAGSIETNFVEETSTLQVNKKKLIVLNQCTRLGCRFCRGAV